jgi:serine/threonine-protein kinase
MADPGTPRPYPPPPVLAGRYELGTLLGTGSTARVYRGVDRLLDRPVAVKLLTGGTLGPGDGAQRLRREARAIAALQHPNVVGVHDIGWTDDALWIVMEHVEGSTLSSLLRERGPLSPVEVVDLGVQVGAALGAAHRAGVVHRDVTPGNVLVTVDGRVKLTDFGIARVAGAASATAEGLVTGTPAYMSPEQVRGDPVDARSDLYSAGCCLYEMLTGRPPFTGDGPLDIARQRLRRPPPPPSAVRPGIPRALERVVLTAMALEPEDRYPDAEAMRRALAATREPDPGEPDREEPDLRQPDLREPDLDEPDLDEADLDEPDEGATRRRIGAVLIVVSTAVLLALAALLLYQRLAG